MMGALSYLYFTKLKNRLKEYLRTPSKIIVFLLMAFLFGSTVYMSLRQPESGKNYRSMDEFFVIVFLLYTMLFINISKNGFSNGASFFSLADINLIFVSPVKSANALFYGIIQQLGTSLYMGAIILLQYAISYEYYGIGLGTVFLVALGYGVTVFLSQMCSMLIYIFTASSDKKLRIGKIIYYGILAVFVLFAVFGSGILKSFSLQNLVLSLRHDFFRLMPVSGIVSLFVEGAAKKSPAMLAVGFLCIIVFSLLFYLILSKAKGEYYEDVVNSAEVSYSAITASKEGTSFEALTRNVKKGKTGFHKGRGASAISEKHKIENRRGKLFIFSRVSVVSIGTTVVYSLVIPDNMLMIFVMSLYSLAISVSAGRWMKELTCPYIYLIPERPFKKLIHAIKEQIPAVIFESVVCFLILHFIMKPAISETVCMIIGRIGFGLVLIGANLVFLKIVGKTEKTFFTMLIYTLISTVCSLPAAFAGIGVGMVYWIYPEFGYVATVPVNIIVFFIILLCCRNILEYSEFNNR